MLGPLLPLIAALVLAVIVVYRAPAAALPEGSLAAVARTSRRWRWAGLLAGSAAAVVTAQWGSLGRGAMLAMPTLGVGVLAGVIAGELRIMALTTRIRTAAVQVRRIRDYLPRRLGTAVTLAVAALAVVLATTTLLGSPDDMGRRGRSLTFDDGASGPWPGSFYSAPLAAAVALGLTFAAWALVRVTRRPRHPAPPGHDDAVRRSAATAVTAAAGLLVAAPLAGVSAVASACLMRGGPAWWPALGTSLVVVALLSVGLTTYCLAVVFQPTPRR